jgi:hypothetical protein
MKRYVKKYEGWMKDRKTTDPIELNRQKQDVEIKNRQEGDKIWITDHPLEGVTAYGKPLQAIQSRYYHNSNGTWGWSVDFNKGEEYINVYTEASNPRQILFKIKLGHEVTGKEELISWCHRNMMYHGVPSNIREIILKKLSSGNYLDNEKNVILK